MNDDHLSQEYNWPKIKWKVSGWLSIISVIIGVILFVFPAWSDELTNILRFIVIFLIVLIPVLLISIIPWIIQCVNIIYMRTIQYPNLRIFTVDKCENLRQLQTNFAEYLQAQEEYRKFEIKMIGENKDKLYIVINKKRYRKINRGDIFEVMDSSDNMPMGRFVITEIRSAVYYAEATEYIDPVLFGKIKQDGATEFTPSLVAVLITTGGRDNDN